MFRNELLRSIPVRALSAMETTKIYLPPVEKGVTVWRPVLAEPLFDATFRIMAYLPS